MFYSDLVWLINTEILKHVMPSPIKLYIVFNSTSSKAGINKMVIPIAIPIALKTKTKSALIFSFGPFWNGLSSFLQVDISLDGSTSKILAILEIEVISGYDNPVSHS